MYTPFRRNPRILPALVSATVAASDAMTLLSWQGTATGRVLGGETVEDSPSSFFGAIAEDASPAQDAAMPPKRARLPFEKGADRSLDAVSCDSFSDSLTVPLLVRKMRRLSDDRFAVDISVW
jgi:hypothetical protein